MKEHAQIIINPAAGAGSTGRKWTAIQSLLKNAGLSFDYRFTEARGHAVELATTAAREGCRYLIAVGGDGTVHEVANAILGAPKSEEISLGIICTGTGSDLSRSVGIPHDYRKACALLTNPRRMLIDVARVTYYWRGGRPHKRFFVNSAGIGFDAAVVEATERIPKYFGGTIPYLGGLLRSLLGYRNKTVTFKLGDEVPQRTKILSMVIANGRYFGGGMKVAPKALADDGLLDVVIIGDFGKLELLRAFPTVYKGTHLTHPKVRLIRTTRITIESDERFQLHADGELLGEGPVAFALIPRALNLVV